jgi:hypothetical protein
MIHGHIRVNHVFYAPYSCLKATEGGMSKETAVYLLKEAGIKVRTKDAYSPYVGHYGLWVEASKQKEADKILFGI